MGRSSRELEPLHLAARSGDLVQVKYLLEVKCDDINKADMWGGTPLYYASLCGHEHVVRYLLETGARCEEDTYEGERCFYAALTEDLRRLLKTYKVTAAHRVPFLEFLRRLLTDSKWSDITFDVRGTVITAHRVVLATRCAYFHQMFKTRWAGRRVVSIKNPKVDPLAFEALVRYLYTGRLDVQGEVVAGARRLCTQLGLWSLRDRIDIKREIQQHESRPRRMDLNSDDSCSPMRLGMAWSRSPPASPILVQDELHEFLLAFWGLGGAVLSGEADFCDLRLSVQGRRFDLHRLFFCGRSGYFNAMLEGSFREATIVARDGSTADDSPRAVAPAHGILAEDKAVELHDISADVFAAVVEFCCCDHIEHAGSAVLQPPLLYELLGASDRFILDGLKSHCITTCTQVMDKSNVMDMLAVARMYDLPRLEDQCMQVMAQALDDVVHLEEFEDLVRESAASIEERQETDSIPFVDELRFHLFKMFSVGRKADTMYTEEHDAPAGEERQALLAERQRRLDLLDDLINCLQLSG